MFSVFYLLQAKLNTVNPKDHVHSVEFHNVTQNVTKLHNDCPEVTEALAFPKGSLERKHSFEEIRKNGSFQYNRRQAILDNPEFM